MLIASVSDFRKDIKSYLDRVAKNFETLIINRGKDSGIVVMSLEEYNSLMATNYELSLFLEIDESIIEEVLLANSNIESLDRIIIQDDKSLELYNKFGYCDYAIENYPLISELEKLSPTERAIIQARYYENMSQSETGRALGMYQMEVSRKEKKILSKLKDNIAA